MKKTLKVLLALALTLSCVFAFACVNMDGEPSLPGSSDSSDSSNSSDSPMGGQGASSSGAQSHEHEYELITQEQGGGYVIKYACTCGATNNAKILVRLYTEKEQGEEGEVVSVIEQNGEYSVSKESCDSATSLSVIFDDGFVKKLFCNKHKLSLVYSETRDSANNVNQFTLTGYECDCCKESGFDSVTLVGVSNGKVVKTYARNDGKYSISRSAGDYQGATIEVYFTIGETSTKLYYFYTDYWTKNY